MHHRRRWQALLDRSWTLGCHSNRSCRWDPNHPTLDFRFAILDSKIPSHEKRRLLRRMISPFLSLPLRGRDSPESRVRRIADRRFCVEEDLFRDSIDLTADRRRRLELDLLIPFPNLRALLGLR